MRVDSSKLIYKILYNLANVAQPAEHSFRKAGVVSSNLTIGIMPNSSYKKLLETISSYGKLCISYSGGVDSTFLARAAVEALGKENVLCVLIKGFALPKREYKNALEYAQLIGVRLITIEVNEFEVEQFALNALDRCYHCKKAIFSHIFKIMKEQGYNTLACGSNIDDLSDYRPGNKAVQECGVVCPLIEAGFDKELIRKVSRKLSLPTADSPSSPCLATRVPYEEPINPEMLAKIDSAEQFLIDLGFGELRVRFDSKTAKIEVKPDKLDMILSYRNQILAEFEKIGFAFVTVDLKGFRSGAMNEVLEIN